MFCVNLCSKILLSQLIPELINLFLQSVTFKLRMGFPCSLFRIVSVVLENHTRRGEYAEYDKCQAVPTRPRPVFRRHG
jgi:hypothetical protein